MGYGFQREERFLALRNSWQTPVGEGWGGGMKPEGGHWKGVSARSHLCSTGEGANGMKFADFGCEFVWLVGDCRRS